VAEVDVQAGAHVVAHLVLQLGQLFWQVAHVVVVDQRQRPHGVDAARDLGAADLGARQVAEQLGAGAAAFLDQDVELAQQGGVDGDAKADQAGFHRRHAISPSPFGET